VQVQKQPRNEQALLKGCIPSTPILVRTNCEEMQAKKLTKPGDTQARENNSYPAGPLWAQHKPGNCPVMSRLY